ncbi:MAG TPA: cytochrome P450 [Pseudonocardiaceae bacterium]
MTATEERLREYPFEPFRGDLPAELLRMVRTEPVSRVRLPDGRATWLVVGYREVCTVLADPRFSRREPGRPPPGGRELSMNGPDHASLRRLAARAFTARRIESYRPRVRETAERLVDAMVAAGPPADLIEALVAPLPALVVCDILGVPRADQDRFTAWAADIFDVTAQGSEQVVRAFDAMRAYLAGTLDAKRAAPGEDLLSAWLVAQATSEEPVADSEIVDLAVGVLLGGREINSTSVGLRALFAHPEALAAVRADPSLLPGAVEEILRYTTVSPMFLVMTALADVELGGRPIAAGDPVMAVPWAANRSPEVFPDPDVFDIRRSPNPHIALGYGPHFCLGAALGRMEIEVAIGTLLRRLPGLRPAIPLGELRWRTERVNCGMVDFPVTW